MTRPRRTALVLSAALSLTLSAAACSSGSTTTGSNGAASSVAAATAAASNGAELEVAAFAAAMQRPGTVVLDVRTPTEFTSGHLAGAVNIDVNAADFTARITALAKTTPYAVYCRSGNRSATAVATMKQLGFTSTYHLAGGIQAWTGSGRPVVTS